MIGCLRLSDVSVICRVVNPRRTLQKIWGGFLYTECTIQGVYALCVCIHFDFDLDLDT